MIPTIENEKVVFLLNAILNDEVRHHAMLKMTLEIIVKGETITEATGGSYVLGKCAVSRFTRRVN